MMPDELETYPDLSGISNRLADLLMETVTKQFNLALSGGNTPKKIYDLISQKPLSWNNIHFFWGDERCVPPDHNESNYKMAKEHLLDKIKIQDHHIHRIKGENDPAIEAERYQKEIIQYIEHDKNTPVFDMILLGLGEDGHIASIFPNQMYLLNSNRISEVAIHPETGQKRITLTGPVINMAKIILIIVTGKAKSRVISDIFFKRGDWKKYPASYINPKNGRLIWIIDSEASFFL